ncbi:MAG: hypothetical protein J6T22_09420 [Bacteroidales bacterium]|nr:hypothetical protein [Bacteroidales bacterium]MBO7617413.1 hypothetical protein [Bacteroidales bacterium]
MRTIDEIKKEANEYQKILDNAPTTIDNGDLLVEYLCGLNYIISRTGVMLAEAVKLRDTARKMVYANDFDHVKKLSASIAKDYVANSTADENALYTWIEQLNKTAKHQADNLRTQVSYAKETLKLTKNGYG